MLSRHLTSPVPAASRLPPPHRGLHAPPAVQVRPVVPEDLPLLDSLLSELDSRSRYRRWLSAVTDVHLAAAWAAHPERQDASGFVAIATNGELVGHAALVPIDHDRAEVCFEVAAPWRYHGVAGRLLVELERRAAERGLRTLVALVLPENPDMLAVLREHGPCRENRTYDAVELELAVDPDRNRLTPSLRRARP